MYAYEYYKKFLQNENFRFEETENIIQFRFQGSTYSIFKLKSDILRIVMICNAKEISLDKLLRTCNDMNRKYFLMSFTVDDDKDTWCSFETKESGQTPSNEFLDILKLIDHATDEYLKALSE